MELKEPKNINYAATVVKLDKFVDLPNCDNVKAALLFGNSVIVSKDASAGEVGLYFPVESQLSAEFLAANNLYRKPEWGNIDPNQKGFFEQHGRVKAVKFRGNKSEGFFIPAAQSLQYLNIPWNEAWLPIGLVFDAIGDHEICRKYVAKRNPAGQQQMRGRVPRLEDKIVEGQFRFHFDTENLRRNIHKIMPEDWISISDKWHGTSVIIANLLINRDLKWYEKVLKFAGVNIQTTKYGITYSSRRVIKEVDGKTRFNKHFYEADIWGTVAKEVKDVIPKGFTLYGEIVGFTPTGQAIQGGYTYGCQVGSHRLLVYRVTSTNPDGHTFELDFPQMKEFCTKYGLETVKELWYGQAKDLFYDIEYFINYDDKTCWPNFFLQELEKKYITEHMCEYNNLQVPAEGIVLRVDKLDQCEAFKLKNFGFLERESKILDKGESDIETEESTTEEL